MLTFWTCLYAKLHECRQHQHLYSTCVSHQEVMLINCSNLDSADHCVFIGTMKSYILEKIFFENWMCPFRYNYSYYYTLTRYQQILFNVYSTMYSLCKTTYVHPGVGANIWSPIVSKNCANVPTKCKGLSLIWLFAV